MAAHAMKSINIFCINIAKIESVEGKVMAFVFYDAKSIARSDNLQKR